MKCQRETDGRARSSEDTESLRLRVVRRIKAGIPPEEPAQSLESPRIRRTGHPGMGGLVQPRTSHAALGLYPPCGSRGKLLPAARQSGGDGRVT